MKQVNSFNLNMLKSQRKQLQNNVDDLDSVFNLCIKRDSMLLLNDHTNTTNIFKNLYP